MSQGSAILAHLKAGHVLSGITALSKFGTFRLAARVAELREAGYPVRTKLVTVRTRDGKARVALYWMARDA